jgi:hypothetical protein
MNTTRIAVATALGLAALLSSLPARAMPVNPLAMPAAPAAQAQNVAWVCGPYRCWWRPSYYGGYYFGPPRAYGYWGPRPFYGPRWGYRRWW